MDPQSWHLVEILENLLFHVLSNDAWTFDINLFPITSGSFENVNLLYFLLKIQIGNGCNVLNIVGNPIKDINVNLSFLSSRWKVLEWTPQWHLAEILENLLFHVLSNDAWTFDINLFPITWGPFENVNLLYFLLKIQIGNGCNVLNIVGNPIKDINVNLSFLSSRWKVMEWTPSRLEKFLTSFLSSGSKAVEWTPKADILWKFWKSTFPCTVQWCMDIWHKPFSHHLRTVWKY